MDDMLKVGERVIWFDSRLRQHRTGTVEVCGKYSYAAYVRPDAGNRHWVPKRKLRRYVDGTPTTTTSPHR